MLVRSRTNVPHLDTEDVEFHTLIGQWFIPKGLALSADTLLEA